MCSRTLVIDLIWARMCCLPSSKDQVTQANENLQVTIKFLNFGTPEIFAVIYLNYKQRGQTLRVFCKNGANGIANSEDPDQTAPLGAV